METLYAASHYGFPRDAKEDEYRPTVSPLPSVKSSSSSDSQDDLLPELWVKQLIHKPALNVPPSPQYQTGVSPLRSQHHSQAQPTLVFTRDFPVGSGPYVADHERFQAFHSSLLLREEPLEYAQSLLPHSRLFPLTGGHRTDQRRPRQMEMPVPMQANMDRNLQRPSIQQRRSSSNSASSSMSDSSGKSRQGSASSCSSTTPSSFSSVSASSFMTSTKNQCRIVSTQLYKTELCVSFVKLGNCPYGSKCQFAHGDDELKAVERPSNWRSKPCANWARSGMCRYGKRCCFKHGE